MAVRRFFLPVLLALLVVLGGCETSFEPYAQTDRYFSIFGFLDAAVDTHWVRVEALQDGRPIGADATIDATVTLTHLATGRRVTLKDSLFSYQERLAHNFHAEMDLELEGTYRLTVRRPDGKTSTAVATLPHAIPELSLSSLGQRATIQGGTEDRLFFLKVIYHTIIEPRRRDDRIVRTFTAQYTDQASRTPTGYSATFDWVKDVRAAYAGGPATITLLSVEVEAGLADPDAPDYGGLSYEELFRPGVPPSNVENGLGYLAGIASDEASVVLPPGITITVP